MVARILSTLVALVLMATVAEARRVALVIGQNAYTADWHPLANPRRDAERIAALLTKHGFEVIACDGKAPGCFDLTHDNLTKAAATLKARATGLLSIGPHRSRGVTPVRFCDRALEPADGDGGAVSAHRAGAQCGSRYAASHITGRDERS